MILLAKRSRKTIEENMEKSMEKKEAIPLPIHNGRMQLMEEWKGVNTMCQNVDPSGQGIAQETTAPLSTAEEPALDPAQRWRE